MTLVFATNNNHKLKEVAAIVPPGIQLLNLKDIECTDELPETGSTFKANAHQKAMYVHEKFGVDCFADDSGLEVEALDGRPGVYSARYSGPINDSNRNIEKLLIEMKGISNRRANFRTVISLLIADKEFYFEGIINGRITEKPIGSGGFGYDSVFIPNSHQKTFAEMTAAEKNSISHRAIAIQQLSNFLKGFSYSVRA